MSIADHSGLSAEQLAELRRETRVSVPTAEWATFGDLIDDWLEGFVEAGIDVEDDESEPEGLYCFSCNAPVTDVLEVVRGLVPEGFEAVVVPVPELSFAGAEILVRRL